MIVLTCNRNQRIEGSQWKLYQSRMALDSKSMQWYLLLIEITRQKEVNNESSINHERLKIQNQCHDRKLYQWRGFGFKIPASIENSIDQITKGFGFKIHGIIITCNNVLVCRCSHVLRISCQNTIVNTKHMYWLKNNLNIFYEISQWTHSWVPWWLYQAWLRL